MAVNIPLADLRSQPGAHVIGQLGDLADLRHGHSPGRGALTPGWRARPVATSSPRVVSVATVMSGLADQIDKWTGKITDLQSLQSLLSGAKVTSGQNAGLRALRVRDFSAGQFTTYEPAYYTPSIGDTYIAIPGCRKTVAACQSHGNILRFGGFPYVPVGSTYKKIGSGA